MDFTDADTSPENMDRWLTEESLGSFEPTNADAAISQNELYNILYPQPGNYMPSH